MIVTGGDMTTRRTYVQDKLVLPHGTAILIEICNIQIQVKWPAETLKFNCALHSLIAAIRHVHCTTLNLWSLMVAKLLGKYEIVKNENLYGTGCN